MSGFTLFKRGGCPVCGGASKGCRRSNTSGLIFCRDGSANPAGYLYRGEDSWGFNLWQATADADAFSQQAREEREEQRRKFLAAEEQRRQMQIKKQMPAVERHKWYTILLERLTLTEQDKQSLITRGFTETQIARDGYRSIEDWQRVGKDFPKNLPGILNNGSLNFCSNGLGGIVCPIRNERGQITGLQFRRRDVTPGMSNEPDWRYRWASSLTKNDPDGSTPHLDGELPIGVFEPDEFKGNSIWLVEGTSIKPSLTRYKLNVPVVGAASGRFTASPEASIDAVKYLAGKHKTNLLTFAIDAGDVVNSSGVPERWKEQFEFFSTRGYQCRIAWWGQVTKQHDDIDELVDTSVIQFITPDEFWGIVQEHRSITPEEKKAKENSEWAWKNWVKSRKFTPHQIIDQQKFTFGSLPDSGAIVAGKSGLGSGKTEELIRVIKASYKGAFLLGYRNNLLFQTGNRAGEFGLTLYHLREDGGIDLVADDFTSIMLCLDSIHHVDGYSNGRDIFIDETVSVLLHAVNGGTLGDAQAKALRILTKALEECNRVFLLDGNLADIYVDFVAKLAKNKRVLKIENKRKIAPHTIKIVEGIDEDGEIKQRDRSALIQFLMQPDIVPWIFCDSKERANVINKILTDLGKQGFVLSSETAAEPWAKELLADPDKYTSSNKPQFAITTPTAESGVSVTLNGYFTHKFSFFVGVQGTNSQHQSMFRLRDNTIPHYVFCPERSNVRDRSNPNTYAAKKFKEILNDRIIHSAVLASQSSVDSERVLEVVGSAIARQQDDWWEFACKLGVLDNFEMDNLRKCLIYALEEAGHDVEVLQWDVDEGIKKLEKDAREFVQRQHAKEIYTAIEFDSVDEARQKAKASPRKETQRRIERTFLLDRLPGIKENDVWSDDFIYECHINRRDFISQQQRYYLVKNFEVSQKRHESAWFYQATGEDFFSARVKRMSHDVIWALQELNILQFIDKEYHKDSPEVVGFIEMLRKRDEVQLALRINHLKPETSEGKERIEILGNLLNLIGYKNASTGQKFVGDIRLRHYEAKPTSYKPAGYQVLDLEKEEFDLESARLAILEAVKCKLTAWIESEKSQVRWHPEPEVEPEVEPIVAETNPAEVAAAVLRTTTNWEDVTLSQEQINIGWNLLTLQEQAKLQQMHETWQQAQLPVEEVEEVVLASEENEAVVTVDKSIRNRDLTFEPQKVEESFLWTRRLNNAIMMSSEIAKSVYTALPQKILDVVWRSLSNFTQQQYCELFASG